jgi:hypothetical protein
MTKLSSDLRPFSQTAAGSTPPLQGVWQNELGSEMAIKSFDGTTFSGTYTSAVSSGGGSVTGTLAGTVNGDAIGFLVNWGGSISAVTSWSGLLLGDQSSLLIYSLWHLASTPSTVEAFWESILAGADIFIPFVPE